MSDQDERDGLLARKLSRRTLMMLGAQTAGVVSLSSISSLLSSPAYAGQVDTLNVVSWGGVNRPGFRGG